MQHPKDLATHTLGRAQMRTQQELALTAGDSALAGSDTVFSILAKDFWGLTDE